MLVYEKMDNLGFFKALDILWEQVYIPSERGTLNHMKTKNWKLKSIHAATYTYQYFLPLILIHGIFCACRLAQIQPQTSGLLVLKNER